MVLTHEQLIELRKQNRGKEIDIFVYGDWFCNQESNADQAKQ